MRNLLLGKGAGSTSRNAASVRCVFIGQKAAKTDIAMLASRARFTLDSFSGVPHPHDMALWTYG